MFGSSTGRALLALCAALAWAGAARAQSAAAEADLKAAVIFNFALFTQWPAATFSGPQEPFTICYADERMATAFASLGAKRLHGRTVAIRRIAPGAVQAGCHLAYWSEGEKAPAAAPGHALLSVAEAHGFSARGGMIELSVENARIQFDVNVDNSRAAGLRVSSKLLRLARKVHGNAED